MVLESSLRTLDDAVLDFEQLKTGHKEHPLVRSLPRDTGYNNPVLLSQVGDEVLLLLYHSIAPHYSRSSWRQRYIDAPFVADGSYVSGRGPLDLVTHSLREQTRSADPLIESKDRKNFLRGQYAVAWSSEGVVGGLWLDDLDVCRKLNDMPLGHIWVSGRYQGNGVGSNLLSFFTEYSSVSGKYRGLMFHWDAQREAVGAFFEQLGFSVQPEKQQAILHFK